MDQAEAGDLAAGRSGPPPQLFGREAEVAAVLALIDRGARQVTLTGPGGIGKTEIAAAVAAEVERAGGRAVRRVELAPFGPGELLDQVLRAVGGASLGGEDLVERVAATLGADRWLLVLDTFEHLVGERARLDGLLERCPGLALLVTSRVRLRGPHERVVPVGPLDVGPGGPAVALFLERASGGAHAAAPDPELAARICAAIDGSPLAIELAAARTAVLPPEAILRWLSGDGERSRLELLGRGGAARAERHRSIRAAAMWSYELLSPDARTVLEHLGVFRGRMSLDAVEGVTAGALDGTPLDALTDLVELHLLSPAPTGDGVARFALLDPLREFALERARASGREAVARERHARWYAGLAARAAAGAEGRDEQRWREEIDGERANLIAALRWLAEHGEHGEALRLAVGLGPYWLHQGPIGQGVEVLGALRERPTGGDRSLEALATAWWLRLRAERGDDDLAAALLAVRARVPGTADATVRRQVDEHVAQALLLDGLAAEAHDVAEAMRAAAAAHGDRYGEATALVLLSRAAQHRGAREEAVAHARAARALADAAGHRRIGARARQALVELGAAPRPVRLLEEVLDAYEAIGDRRGVILACVNLGVLAFDAGDRPTAARWYLRALRGAEAIDYRHGEAFAVVGIAALAAADGRPADAVALDAALRAATPAAARIVPPDDWAGYRELVEGARAALGRDAAAAAAASPGWTAAMATAGTIAAELGAVAVPLPAGVEPLTARELEVLGHLARGATNRQIAAELHLSPKTVMHHASRIFRKLGVRGRAEAVDAGHRLGLLAAEADAPLQATHRGA